MSPRLIPPSLAVTAPVLAGLLLTGCGGSTTTVSTPNTTSVPSTTATDESPSTSDDSHTDGGR